MYQCDNIKVVNFLWYEMSRQPKRDQQASMHANMNPYGAIDFVDNHNVYANTPICTGVVGGPPAFLDAHGIRYIPMESTTLTSEPDMSTFASDPSLNVQPMWKPAPEFDAQALNDRVDSRISAYMNSVKAQKQTAELSRKISKLQADVASASARASMNSNGHSSSLRGENHGSRYRSNDNAPSLRSEPRDDMLLHRLQKLERDIRESTPKSTNPPISRQAPWSKLNEYEW